MEADSYMGLFFALITTLSWSIGIFPFTEASRRLGINSLNHFRLFLAVILLFVTAFLINHSEFINLFNEQYVQAWIWFGLSGVVGLALGDYFYFGLYAIMGARIGSIFSTLSPAAALVTSYFFVDERINFIGVIGIFLTMAGVIFISISKSENLSAEEGRYGSDVKGVLFGVLAAFCQGVGLVLAKKGFVVLEQEGKFIHPINATFVRMVVSLATLILITTIFRKWKEVLRPLKSNSAGLKYAAVGTFFGPVFGVCMSLYTIAVLEATVAQTIFSLVPVVAALIARYFYKEKFTLASVIATIIAVAGVVLLIRRNEVLECLYKSN